jgi:hypothetical protein
MSRLAVVYGTLFPQGGPALKEAQLKFPPERSTAYSGPTFGEFMDRPVRAARVKFSRDWHNLPEDFGGLARSVVLPAAGAFVPVVFYGLLVVRVLARQSRSPASRPTTTTGRSSTTTRSPERGHRRSPGADRVTGYN